MIRWPGALARSSTHGAVFARLIIDGKDYGIHPFLVQLRGENHQPLPGIEVGDIGPKFGFNNIDNGIQKSFDFQSRVSFFFYFKNAS